MSWHYKRERALGEIFHVRRLDASRFVGLVVIRVVPRPLTLRVGLFCLMVLILEVIRRLDVTGVAYFEYERPSVGAFESASPEIGLNIPEPLVTLMGRELTLHTKDRHR